MGSGQSGDQALKHGRGFSLFELMVVVMVISLLGLVLLDRLSVYQEQAEKSAMEQTVTILRVALVIRTGEMRTSGQDSKIAGMTAENPMGWLSRKPANYAGEFDGAAVNIPEGSWYFDSHDQALVYKVKHKRRLGGEAGEKGEIRFRVKADDSESTKGSANSAVDSRIGALLIQAVPPYIWF